VCCNRVLDMTGCEFDILFNIALHEPHRQRLPVIDRPCVLLQPPATEGCGKYEQTDQGVFGLMSGCVLCRMYECSKRRCGKCCDKCDPLDAQHGCPASTPAINVSVATIEPAKSGEQCAA